MGFEFKNVHLVINYSLIKKYKDKYPITCMHIYNDNIVYGMMDSSIKFWDFKKL